MTASARAFQRCVARAYIVMAYVVMAYVVMANVTSDWLEPSFNLPNAQCEPPSPEFGIRFGIADGMSIARVYVCRYSK